MKIYGANICGNCVEAKEYLKAEGLPYVEVDITESTSNLKEFLALRDNNDLYNDVKEAGKIGIPTFVMTDGRISLNLNDFTREEIIEDYEKETTQEIGLCGFDGC